ncbi:WxL domain-containing protein [Enterococcus ratti]|uniref:WxL domain-containing protein n=1 Tax=Enterococcus ratti TaxID=150033 RepID=UPI000900317C|nr:WxL domain-containing protein [Enterococcus ratti]
MKKIVLATILLSAVGLGSTVVHAEDLKGTSTAKIGLSQQDPDHPVGPIDPVDPDDDPNSNDPTGNTGVLRIDYISNIDFGKQTISGSTQTYAAQKPALRTEAQVSDLRGTGASWNLQVNYDSENSGFQTQSGQTLKGAQLTLPVGTLKTVENNQSAAPTTSTVVVNTDAQNIMTSDANTGLGTWADQMNTSEVSLQVPSGNLAGDYTATLEWTLTDAPA